MSDLVSRLREIRRASERGSYVGTGEVLWLLDEIERLTSENKLQWENVQQLLAENERLTWGKAHHLEERLNAGKAMVEAQNAAAVAEEERERLTRERDKAWDYQLRAASDLADTVIERNRLRAVLEQIARPGDFTLPAEIAREALRPIERIPGDQLK